MQDDGENQSTHSNQEPLKHQNNPRSISDADAEPPDDVETAGGPVPPKPEEKKEEAPKQTPPPVAPKNSAATVNGVLAPANIDEAFRMASAYHQSGLFPNFDSPQKILVAMQFSAELGLPVLTAARQMYVLNGTPHIWGDLPLALVRKSGQMEYIRERVLDKDGKDINLENKNLNVEPHTSICTVKRKNEDERSFFWTWAEAKAAGLVDKNRSIWKLYPKRMMQMRVRSLALKDVFGDILSGVGIAEYDDYADARDVTTTTNRDVTSTGDLNKEL